MTGVFRGMTAITVTGLALAAGAVQAEEITVSSWGGFFEETLAAEIYPGFTEATGIAVRSIAQPADQAWLTQLTSAARAGKAPADLSLVSDEVLARGRTIGLWAALDPQAMPSTDFLKDGFVKADDDGAFAVAALSFWSTFVTNTDFRAEAPESWAELWSADWDGKLGMASAVNSGLLEITAVTHFGGYEIMETRDGLEQVIAKIAELKPQVRLWYRDEGQFQQGLESGEFNGGTYFHDVAMLSIYDGNPIASTFPKEGGVLSDAFWIVPRDSKHADAAQKFIDYMSQPTVQAQMARVLGVAPVAKRELMDLTEEEFAAVSSELEPIRVQTEIHLREGDWLADKYLEMISQ